MMAAMARIRLFHWKAQESEGFIEPLRGAGHHVSYDEKIAPGLFSRIRQSPPDAFVIALSRLPSHGREVATFVRGSPATRHLPIVFVDGDPEKVEAIRQLIPDAVYTTRERLTAALAKAIAHPPAAPVVPVQMMDRYGTRTTAQKLGIKEGCRVALLDAPRDYASVLGPLPDGVELCEEPSNVCAVTLWFVEDAEIYRSTLPRMRRLAVQTKLWVIWPKGGQKAGITQQLIRDSALAVGLVDYKICSVSDRWSAMAFAKKKA
jgi:CheY-like chemotaxis protein